MQEAQMALAQAALRRKRGALEAELLDRSHAATALEAAISQQDRQVEEAESRLAALQHSLQARLRTDPKAAPSDLRLLGSGVSGGAVDKQLREQSMTFSALSRVDVVTQPALPKSGGVRGRAGGIRAPALRPISPGREEAMPHRPPTFGRDGSPHSAPSNWLLSPGGSLPSPPLQAAGFERPPQPRESEFGQAARLIPSNQQQAALHETPLQPAALDLGHASSGKSAASAVAGPDEASALLKLRAEVHALKSRCMTQVRRNRSRQRGPARGGRCP